MAKLKDDQIKWILSLDAKGVQSELKSLSSHSQTLADENKKFSAELKEATKQMVKAEAQMEKLAAAGKEDSDKFRELEGTVRETRKEVDWYSKVIRENEKVIKENTKITDEMVRTLKIEDMTRSQLTKTAKELQNQLDHTSKSTNPEAYKALRKELDAVEDRMAELKKGTDDTKKEFSLFSKEGAKGAAIFLVGVTAAKKGLEAFYDLMMSNKATSTQLKAEMDGLNNGWDYMKTAIANVDFTDFFQNMKEAIRLGREASLMLDELFERENSFKLTAAPIRAELEEMKTDMRDVNLPLEERIRLGKEVLKQTAELAELEKTNAKQKVDATLLLLESHTKLNESEREYVITNYNKNRESIQNAKEILAEEQKISKNKFASNAYELQLNNQLNAEIQGRIELLKQSGNYSEEAYNSIKKYMQADNNLIGGYVDAQEAFLNIDAKTKRETRMTERLVNQMTKKKTDTALGGSTPEQRQRRELQIQLTNQENAHKEELQLLEETRLKEKKTDEKHKIDVAKSDKKFYEERLKLLQDYKSKVTDSKFQSEIDSQILDARGNVTKQDPIVDSANITALQKNRDELLQVERVSTNELKKVQSEREEIAQVSALRQQSLELSSSQNRLEILKQYSKDVEELEIQDGLVKEKLVREANDAVIQAETDAILKRKALDKLYKDSNDSVRSKYGNVTVSEQKQNEKAILEALHNEKLISEDAYQQAVVAIEKKYETQKLQVKRQYGIETAQETYELELAQLQEKLDQELLTQKEFEEAKKQIQLDYATQTTQKINQVSQMGVNMGNAIQQAATAKLESEYAIRIAAAEGNADEQQRLEEELAEKKLELEKKYADVQFAIKAAEIVSSTAVAIMVAYKQLGPIMGSVAAGMLGVTGAAQLIAANAEREKVKALTLGSSGKSKGGAPSSGSITVNPRSYAEGGHNAGVVGGYTGDGGRYDVAGMFQNGATFHRGEYIIASPELARPEVVGMVRRLESIRRQRTSANSSNSFAEGGVNDYSDPNFLGVSDPSLIIELKEAIKAFNNKKLNLGASELQADLDEYNKEKQRFSQNK